MFGPEGKVMTALDRFWTALALNLLWLICCFPVITIGAATGAFYETARTRVLKGDGNLFATFFKTFQSNFLQATALELLGIVILAVGGLTFSVAYQMGLWMLYFAILFELLVFLCLFYWSIPLAVRFKNKTLAHVRNGLLMGFGHLWSTLLLLLMLAVTIWIIYIIFPLIFVLPIAVMLFWVWRVERVLIKRGFVQ